MHFEPEIVFNLQEKGVESILDGYDYFSTGVDGTRKEKGIRTGETWIPKKQPFL